MTNLEKKIQTKLSTKSGTIAKKYLIVYDLIMYGEVHGITYKGSYSYINKSDKDFRNVEEAAKLLGLDYYIGNDAKRKGVTGTFVALTEKGRKQVSAYRNSILKIKRAEIKVLEDKYKNILIKQSELKQMPGKKTRDLQYSLNSLQRDLKYIKERWNNSAKLEVFKIS